ncbi:pyridine nucleotide-disulfide oxidoreductase [Caldovatus sediminis]|uniref:Pyridine nucleotide-disulfide oxidoreductase n=1 Tax=Caldovatus sediminis TaxID=2041189 RepID=A0A8J2ZD78_9PROT|nr:FAD-dependent oxidoreductase [Caldovatus sediminis]GGG39599.1 pyridine nucleotide-disulfide oxidoreductase [Caldovatus sediminis]
MEPTAIRPEEGFLLEPARRTPVVREVDVLICGGGVAGIGAALGAARAGARTMVIERNAFLGGAATGVLMNTWNVPVRCMTGVAREIARSLAARGAGVDAGPTFPFDPEALKELAVELLSENGVKILNYTWVVDPVMEGSRIRGVVIQNKSGRQAILARCVVDATGDADLAAAAGAEYVKGREEDGKMRPMSVLFRLGGVDVRRVVEYCRSQPAENFTADPNFHILKPEEGLVRFSGFFDIAARARAAGELPEEVHYLRMEGVDVERGIVTVNNSRVYGVDGTNAWDITRADLEARMQNRRILKVIKRDIPGFEKAYVIDSSPTVGVRETRRVRGRYVLTQADNVAQRRFPDSVARIWRHMAVGRDWHKATGGEGAPDDAVYRTATTDLTFFEIPWRVFVPNGVEGMTVGGRALSVSHDADMWTRGQYCCLVTGQVAGVGAALAARQGTVPSALDTTVLQRELEGQDVDIGSAGRNAEEPVPVRA